MPVGRVGHGPEGTQRGVVLRAAERRETAGEESDVVEARVGIRVEVAAEPACACPPVPVRALVCNQVDELEQLAECRPSELSEGGFGDEQVAVLAGSLEKRTGMTGGQ
jgi:hypothetical protein